MWASGDSATSIIQTEGLEEISDTAQITTIVDDVLANNTKQVQQYRDGNQKLLGFFVGQVMKKGQGKINPKIANKILLERLNQDTG